MEKLSPVYGSDDNTVLILEPEETLLDDLHADGDGETTLLAAPSIPLKSTANVMSFGDAQSSIPEAKQAVKSGYNPLLIAAQELLNFGIDLSHLERDVSIRELRQKAVHLIRLFESRCQALSQPKALMLAARYVLCTYLDEMVVTSPWGKAHEWSQESLLSQFHGETYGGQGFFTILQRACEEPRKNVDFLELLFVILSLGFEGKYRLDQDGQRKVDSLRDMVMGLIRRAKTEERHQLAVGEPATAKTTGTRQSMPWGWMIFGVVLGLVLLQTALALLLSHSSHELIQQLDIMNAPIVTGIRPIA